MGAVSASPIGSAAILAALIPPPLSDARMGDFVATDAAGYIELGSQRPIFLLSMARPNDEAATRA